MFEFKVIKGYLVIKLLGKYNSSTRFATDQPATGRAVFNNL